MPKRLQNDRGLPFGYLLVSLMLVMMIVPFAFNPAKALGDQPLQPIVKTEVVSMMPEMARSLIEQAAASWRSGDARAFADLFAPDGEFVVPGQRWLGAAAIEKTAAEFAASHAHVNITIRRILFAEQQAVVEWQWEETENKTGKRTQADDAIVVDFAAGKIKRWREYIDSQTPQTG